VVKEAKNYAALAAIRNAKQKMIFLNQ